MFGESAGMMNGSKSKEKTFQQRFGKKGRRHLISEMPPLGDGCKPDSVRPMACATGVDGHLSCPSPCGGRQPLRAATNTRRVPPLARRSGQATRSSPVLSCTTWGFSCPLACAWGGGLLPRLFTLTDTLSRYGGLFSVTLSVNRSFRLGFPRVLHGMMPYGVRTFLSTQPCGIPRATVRHHRSR